MILNNEGAGGEQIDKDKERGWRQIDKDKKRGWRKEVATYSQKNNRS